MKIYETTLQFRCVREDAPDQAVSKPALVMAYMAGAFDGNPMQESVWVVSLNRKNVPISRHMVTLGTATACLAHPREVFRPAILANATGIVIVHNHPSGDPTPSNGDLQFTQQIRNAATIVGIELLDHVVIGDAKADPSGRGYYSFREAGML